MRDTLKGLALSKSVLDYGLVKLIDVMPRMIPESYTADFAIVEAARASNGGGLKEAVSDKQLLRYLFRCGHTSPFEMCETKWFIKLPIFVARQWIRHRTASVNEISGRYTELPAEMHQPKSLRKQNQFGNLQGSHGEIATHGNWIDEIDFHNGESFKLYKSLLTIGVAREQAREVLPLSTYTQWIWKIDLHNLLHFLAVRADAHAQEEIRIYAEAMIEITKLVFPWTMEAFEEYHPLRGGLLLSATEVEILNGNHKAIEKLSKTEKLDWDKKIQRIVPLKE